MKHSFLFIFGLLLLASCSDKPTVLNDYNDAIRINQIGYYPEAPKKAVLASRSGSSSFTVVDTTSKTIVYTGELSAPVYWSEAGETVRIADFSPLKIQGSYIVQIDSLGNSYPFSIRDGIYSEAFPAALKALYYQRASSGLEASHAGIWARSAGHPDSEVMYHPSSGKAGIAAAPGGWYDAGDFGKYVVNGAFPLGQMLSLYEQYPGVLADGALNIPESGNGIPDILDELKYELDWLLLMQDEDGGVFFKLTAEGFEGMIMPEASEKQRWIIGKSTTATLDFAAVAAKASRLYRDADSEYADKCLQAAKKAWSWAIANPEIAFKNPEGVVTGEYGDGDFSQEFFWAAAELFATTTDEEYEKHLAENPVNFEFMPGESWANFMHYLGAIALVDNLEPRHQLSIAMRAALMETAEQLLDLTGTPAYFQPISDFQWGSNSDVLNSAMLIAQAYRLSPDPKYLSAVQEITDYIFGKNATGYSFVTGFGSKTPMFIHHRQSAADGIAEPVPGFISGGPNSRQHDKNDVTYPPDCPPMKSWVDVEPSYASNEICLNWNSAAVYVLGFLEQETKN